MKLFVKTLIKFCIAFGILLLSQFFFFYITFKNFVDLSIDNSKSILILGDSHLQTNLNDSIIEGSINLCNGAEVAYFEYVKLKRLKEINPHIDTLILGFNWENIYSNDFYHLQVTEARFQNYFYMMEIKDYQVLIKKNFEVIIRSSIGMIKNFGKLAWIFRKNNIKSLELGGYLPRPNDYSELEYSIEREARKEGKFEYMDNFSQMEVKYFLKIVSFCRDNNIKLIVLNAPIHSGISNLRKSEKANYLTFLREVDGDFDHWDYENFRVADELFFDYNHLNGNGANIFSKIINNKLKDSLSVLDN